MITSLANLFFLLASTSQFRHWFFSFPYCVVQELLVYIQHWGFVLFNKYSWSFQLFNLQIIVHGLFWVYHHRFSLPVRCDVLFLALGKLIFCHFNI